MSRISNLASERGAVLIQTALAGVVLIGFSTFVVDYGVLWVARHQAQNAADAGAMAGAIARAYEDFDDPPDPAGTAAQYAERIAGANLVWGKSAPETAAVASFDGTCPPDVGAPSRCVRVDVYRNGEQGSERLKAWFAPALGLPATQVVKATARAQVLIANSTNCLRPWAIPDRWIEGRLPATEFEKYDATGMLLTPHDDYNPPTALDPGISNYKFATSNGALEDVGLSIATTLYTNPADPIVPGLVVALEPDAGYLGSIPACNGQTIAVGDQVSISATVPQSFDFHNLFTRDPGASWNGRAIKDSCAPLSCAPPSAFSPRLVAIAVFDVDLFQRRRATSDWSGCPLGNPCVSIVNIVGFFINNASGSSGYLTSYPGVIPTEPPMLTAQSSFLKAVTLVR